MDAGKAVEIAFTHSLKRQMARADVTIAQDRINQASAAFGPRLTLESGLYRYNDAPSLVQLNEGIVRLNNALSMMTSGMVAPKDLPDDSLTYYGAAVQLTQPLFTGYRLTASKHMAQANRQYAEDSLAAVENDLVLDVKKAYYTVLLTRQTALAMDDAVSDMEQHVHEAAQYHALQVVSKLDVLRAREKLADLKQQQVTARNNFSLAKAALNHVLGVDLDTVYTFNQDLTVPAMPGNLDLCQRNAVQRRPEIAALDAKIKMAKDRVSIANAAKLPVVALKGGVHHYEPENQDPSAQIGLVASLTLWDHGRTKHEVAQALHQLEKLGWARKQALESIALEVRQAFCNARTALTTIDVTQAGLDTADEVLRGAKTRYKVGLSTSLERLDAQVSLTRARTRHIQALSMYNISLCRLERAMGQGAPQHNTTS